METVEVVIKIPKKCKEFLDNGGKVDWLDVVPIIDAVANGIVLPKGHGNLVDWGKVVDIVTEFVPDDDGSVGNTNLKDLLYEVENMEQVIEADREA